MKKIECIIMDWAGTAVDYGCFAPVAAFMKAFAEKGLSIDVKQTRKPMGLPKIQHIRELLTMPEVNEQFISRYQRSWAEEDVVELNRLFEEYLFASLEEYTDPIPGVIPTLEKLRTEGLKIGSTTGYTREGCCSSCCFSERILCRLLRYSEFSSCRASGSLYDF